MRLEGSGQLVNRRRKDLEWLDEQAVSRSGATPQGQGQANAAVPARDPGQVLMDQSQREGVGAALAALNADLDSGDTSSEDDGEEEEDDEYDEDGGVSYKFPKKGLGGDEAGGGEVRSSGRVVSQPKWMADKE